MTQVPSAEKVADTEASPELSRGEAPEPAAGVPYQWPPWADRALAISIPTLLLITHARYYGEWIEDDAGLTFAYARSLATGAGPVLQPGAVPVEAYSNPAWLAILVLGRSLGLFDHGVWFGTPDIVLFPKIVALICCIGMFAIFYSVARLVSRHAIVLTSIAGVSTAAVPSFVIWTMSGLENSLFALSVVAVGGRLARAMIQGQTLERRTAVVCGALAALAALTRPDGLIYALAYPIAVALLAERSHLRRAVVAGSTSLGIFAVPVGIYEVWRVVTFGDWLPNTARAKEQGVPGPQELGSPANLVAYSGWLCVVLAVAAVAIALQYRSTTRSAVGMLLIPLSLAVVAFATLRPDWMAQYRFATPIWPLAALTLTLAAAYLASRAAKRTRIAAAVLAVVALTLSTVGWYTAATNFARSPTAPLCHVAQDTGYMVNSYADILGVRNGTLLAVDGGGTALTSRLRFVDLAGLADARMAGYWHDNNMAGLRDYVFNDVRPTFFRIWVTWGGDRRTKLVTDPRLVRDYEVVFSPATGSGTWVRRDAVSSAAALAQARRWAPAADARMRAMYAPVTERTDWHCPATLRPGPFT